MHGLKFFTVVSLGPDVASHFRIQRKQDCFQRSPETDGKFFNPAAKLSLQQQRFGRRRRFSLTSRQVTFQLGGRGKSSPSLSPPPKAAPPPDPKRRSDQPQAPCLSHVPATRRCRPPRHRPTPRHASAAGFGRPGSRREKKKASKPKINCIKICLKFIIHCNFKTCLDLEALLFIYTIHPIKNRDSSYKLLLQ